MRVAMIGTGYVGLVSGVCFADFGHQVICVDKDPKKIKVLNEGGIPIYEPGLDNLVAKNVREGRLEFTTEINEAVRDADAVFIAVGTPSRRGDGHADLSFVYAAAKEIAAVMEGYTVIITKSTVPVGTGDEVQSIIKKAKPNGEFDVVSNPEFLREGAAIEDFKRPDRVVVGTMSERARDVMRRLYRPLFINETPMVFTDRRTSELIKYAGNAFLATKITFINEIADLCEKVGANVQEVSKGIGLDGRIGKKFLHAGPGYGGSCFPKDTLAVVRTAQEAGAPLRIVEAVVDVNDQRKAKMHERIVTACGGQVKGKTISILGLAFKPNTDDMRESPSIPIIENLRNAGAHIRAYDPEAMEEAKHLLPDITYCDNAYTCAEKSDVLVIVTEWDQFRALDFERLKSIVNTPVLVDLRNIYSPSRMADMGFTYSSIGRP
ncbi:MAG: UDP-glucose/GDP-mannose dehydrogenase family protein [Hyphomonadaceae bacterium]|nr:UDP-glucose/GDP-mannose dehydrogenase family protein [Hyphomonadaceae bacterium]